MIAKSWESVKFGLKSHFATYFLCDTVNFLTYKMRNELIFFCVKIL